MFDEGIRLGRDWIEDTLNMTYGQESEYLEEEIRRFRLTEFGGGEFVSKFPDLPANRCTVTSEEVVESWERDIQGPNRGFTSIPIGDRGSTSSAAAYAKVVLESSFAGSKRSGVAAIDAQIENWEEAVEKFVDEDKLFAPPPNYGVLNW